MDFDIIAKRGSYKNYTNPCKPSGQFCGTALNAPPKLAFSYILNASGSDV